MIHEFYQWSYNLWLDHTPTIFLVGYALPLFVNAGEFILRTVKEYHKDLKNREAYSKKETSYYSPTLTLGHIVARIIGTVTPFLNFIVMLANMDRVFEWIGNIFSWIGRVLDTPLVPNRN